MFASQSLCLDAAMERARAMVAEGASFLDIGGESTRPGADRVSVQQELDRVIPVIEAIRASLNVVVSVDTSTPEVMIAAGKAGAGLINDVRALGREGLYRLPLVPNYLYVLCICRATLKPCKITPYMILW